MYTQKEKKLRNIKSVAATQLKKKDTSGHTLKDNRSETETTQLVAQLAHSKNKSKSKKNKHQKGERQLQAAQMQARWRQLYNSSFSKSTPFCKNWVKKNRALHGDDFSKWTKQKM